MVLRDLDGGHITAVSYDSNAPDRAHAQVVRRQPDGQPDASATSSTRPAARRSRSSCSSATPAQPGTLTGTIIGVEKQKQAGRQGRGRGASC